jgi:hypothetical protein
MTSRLHPETIKIIATKAQRHKGFIFNKTFCVTLCLRVLVAVFISLDKQKPKRKKNAADKRRLARIKKKKNQR